ncbi:MAG TPA: hypothetical protein VIR34_10715 [Gemmatimonadaceae bacterium]|jgi:hypothetical protein
MRGNAHSPSRVRVWQLVAALPFFPSLILAQGNSEIIRGRVRSADLRPMPGVVITVTGLQSRTA